jgi:hypothetical protein
MVRRDADPAGEGAVPHILLGLGFGPGRFEPGPGRAPGAIAIALGAGMGLAVAGPAAAQAPDAAGGPVTVTGVRASRGDAVECPRLRDDAGALHPVSYLPPRIAVGDRVTVSGTLAVTTACRGVVLVVEKLVEGARQGRGAPGGG